MSDRYAFIDSNNIIQYILTCNSNFVLDGYVAVLDNDESANIGYTFSNNSFIAPIPEFSNYQQSLLDNLSTQLTAQEAAGVMYESNLFPTDANSQIKYLGLAYNSQIRYLGDTITTATIPNFTTNFKTLNNGYVTLTSDDILNLSMAVNSYITAVNANDELLLNQINSASNTVQLLSIDVTQGWPTSS